MPNHDLRLVSFLSRLIQPREKAATAKIKVFNLTQHRQVADQVELAGENRQRRKGLLGRESLGAGEGLWIVPCEAVHTFWMRFPLDLIYLDRRHRVVKTRSGVPPWRLSACLRAHSVLELPAGTISKTQTMRGDHLALNAER